MVYSRLMRSQSPLVRGLDLREATASNVVTMIGSAIFVTLPLVLSAMGGPQAMLAWLIGMLIALPDGLAWASWVRPCPLLAAPMCTFGKRSDLLVGDDCSVFYSSGAQHS